MVVAWWWPWLVVEHRHFDTLHDSVEEEEEEFRVLLSLMVVFLEEERHIVVADALAMEIGVGAVGRVRVGLLASCP
jgi:hypothetical protein